MRWDDSLGVHPSLLVQRARGVLGQLERTKPSGADKQALTLPIFVSEKAYLVEPQWLNTWLALLQSEDYGFERDYLLPLANEKLNGCLRRRAEYSDAVGYSRALLLSLPSPGDTGEALLLEEAVGLWTQRTERCGLDSWLAAMGAKKSERGFLGRWAVTGSQDRYVRTATRVVEDLQIRAAHAAVLLLNGGYDRFGEETTLEGLRTYLLQKGVEPAAAERQVQRPTRADTSVFPPGAGPAEGPGLSAARWQPSAPSEPAVLSEDEASQCPQKGPTPPRTRTSSSRRSRGPRPSSSCSTPAARTPW
jgi:hypothetical protein